MLLLGMCFDNKKVFPTLLLGHHSIGQAFRWINNKKILLDKLQYTVDYTYNIGSKLTVSFQAKSWDIPLLYSASQYATIPDQLENLGISKHASYSSMCHWPSLYL